MRTVRPRRLGVRGPASVLLTATAIFALAACGNSDDPEASGTSPSTPTTSSTPTETTPSETPPSETATETATPKPAKARVTIKAGVVNGAPEQLDATVGQTVQIKVKSDVAEELQVVGLDQTLALPAGEAATLEFVVPADPGAGSYDVKLGTSGTVLFKLVVS
jgi:hypothetical protein